MAPKRARRKSHGVGAILTLRYPADEVPDLDAAAEAKGLTRGAFMYDAIAKAVRRGQGAKHPTEPLRAAS